MANGRVTARRAASGVVRGAAVIMGRRRAVRAARFTTNVLRFDDGNRIDTNGEALVQEVARSRPAPVIFDVGSNVGQWSTSLLKQSGHKPQLHLFEPSSFSFERASQALGDRAQVHQIAFGAEQGDGELQIVKQGAGVNSLVPVDRGGVPVATETVAVETVAGFCQDHGIAEVTLLKIDAEGADLSVLVGAREMFAQARVGISQFEYNWRWVYSRTYLRDVFELVEGWPGYSIGKVTPHAVEFYEAWHPELETFRESNYVIVRDDWRASFPTVEWWGG